RRHGEHQPLAPELRERETDLRLLGRPHRLSGTLDRQPRVLRRSLTSNRVIRLVPAPAVRRSRTVASRPPQVNLQSAFPPRAEAWNDPAVATTARPRAS